MTRTSLRIYPSGFSLAASDGRKRSIYPSSPSVRRSVGPSVRRSVGPSVRRSVGPSVRRSVGPSVRRSVGPSVRLSVGLSVCPSVRRIVGPSVRQSVCPVLIIFYSNRSSSWLLFSIRLHSPSPSVSRLCSFLANVLWCVKIMSSFPEQKNPKYCMLIQPTSKNIDKHLVCIYFPYKMNRTKLNIIQTLIFLTISKGVWC